MEPSRLGSTKNPAVPTELATILEPLELENNILSKLLFQSRNPHRRKRYWVQTYYASNLVKKLVQKLYGWEGSTNVEEAQASVEYVRNHVEEAAICWRESLVVFGFFNNLAEVVFALLARETKLLVQLENQCSLRCQSLSVDQPGKLIPQRQQHRQHDGKRLHGADADLPAKRHRTDALSLFLERVDEETTCA
eukprot:Protomagalhaensia_wolfi_Nauph_80__1874@NODE_2172_length_1188_cov_457_974761_g1699_i0_p1_GENE_NODE_2172_length_1188_cov_457_974761_g1699_i0NODE_2172_length_1188_cov_457_974761_g1699_i0_p1_ORF_typecomplete_len193_score26_46DUF4477/PF14780_6/0_24_NODE_2172_length_1188_cov_457_974761_g1699_i05681146